MRREGAQEGEPHQVPNTHPWYQTTGRWDKQQRSREGYNASGDSWVQRVMEGMCPKGLNLGRRVDKLLLSSDKYNTSN